MDQIIATTRRDKIIRTVRRVVGGDKTYYNQLSEPRKNSK